MTHMKGADATSVAMCAVTATSSADGTKESNIHSTRSRRLGSNEAFAFSVAIPRCGPVRNTTSNAHPIIRIPKAKNPTVHHSDCWRNVRFGSKTSGYANSDANEPMFDAPNERTMPVVADHCPQPRKMGAPRTTRTD